MIRIINEEEGDIRVVTRNLRGQDGPMVTVESGGETEVDIDGQNYVVVSSGGGTPVGKVPMQTPPAPRLVSEDTTLTDTTIGTAGDNTQTGGARDATDQELSEVLDVVHAKGGDAVTAAGAPKIAAINAELATRNLNPIDAARRDAYVSQNPDVGSTT